MLPVHVPFGSHIVNSDDDDEESAFVGRRGAVGGNDNTGVFGGGLAGHFVNSLWTGAPVRISNVNNNGPGSSSYSSSSVSSSRGGSTRISNVNNNGPRSTPAPKSEGGLSWSGGSARVSNVNNNGPGSSSYSSSSVSSSKDGSTRISNVNNNGPGSSSYSSSSVSSSKDGSTRISNVNNNGPAPTSPGASLSKWKPAQISNVNNNDPASNDKGPTSGDGDEKKKRQPDPAPKAAGAVVPPLDKASAKLGERIEQAPVQAVGAFSATVSAFSQVASITALFVGVVLLLFVVHQLFIWFDQDPEKAFDQAGFFLEAVELVWDTGGILVNAGVDVANSAFIPVYNGAAYYVAEPVVVLVLEVFSLVFVGSSWNGIIDETQFPYAGMDCLANAQAAQWCGRYSYYEAKLLGTGYANDSIIFGTGTARRLSELSADETFVTPEFDMGNLTSALDDLTTLAIAVGAPVADVGAGVLDDVMISSGKQIFDLFMTVIRQLFEVLKMLVKSGLLPVIIGIGVDYLIIYYVHWQLPIMIAVIDFISCIIDLFIPSGWSEQLKCATNKCFNGGDGSSDLLLFTSVPVVINQFGKIMDATLNSNTGRRFSGSFAYDFGTDIANWLTSFAPASPAVQECATCFNCKFPEMRMVWLVIAVTTSIASPSFYGEFAGDVTAACQDNGTFYALACGPRGAGAEVLPFREWKNLYKDGYMDYDDEIVNAYAAQLAERAEDMDGAASYAGGLAKQAADAWFRRDTVDNPDEEAANFMYQTCRIMRQSDLGAEKDIGPGYSWGTPGSLGYIAGEYLYASCKRQKQVAFGDSGRAVHGFLYEIAACSQDKVWCKKEFEQCIGSCGGTDANLLRHSFETFVSKGELSAAVLGEAGLESASANCTVKQATVLIPLFDGGDSFKTFAARIRVRSGMTAIDTLWCQNNAISCGAIQRVLERSPGLRFINGEFRHVWSLVPPSPPSSPSPPPGLGYVPDPPRPSPPPISPPPYYQDAEPCLPLPLPEQFGSEQILEESGAGPTELRAACLFSKRILDERRKASNCFASIAHPSPPPPPLGLATSSRAQEIFQQREQMRRGEDDIAAVPQTPDPERLANEASNAIVEVRELIKELGETQPILKSLLGGAVTELEATILNGGGTPSDITAGTSTTTVDNGRRLMVRNDYSEFMTDWLSDHPVQKIMNGDGIPGLTSFSCEALCAAVSDDQNRTETQDCRAYAFRRSYPFSKTDLTGRCWILRSPGACKPEDFGAELYLRHYDSENTCTEITPGNDAETCIGLPASNAHANVLTHFDAAAIAARLPNMKHPAYGAGGLPVPRTTLEAMSFVAYARQQGVYAFWAGTPNTALGAVTTHWITEGATELIYGAEEHRCILVSSGMGVTERMYSHLRPCDAKLADGVLTVAAAAAPPPPPGSNQFNYSFFDPHIAPPPPPSILSAAWELYTKSDILPRTEAICNGGMEGRDHQHLCTEMAEHLASWQPVAGVGLRAPICKSDICWKSCDANHVGGDDDSFTSCSSLSCAKNDCMDFLKAACPPTLHNSFTVLYDSACTIVMPHRLEPSPPLPSQHATYNGSEDEEPWVASKKPRMSAWAGTTGLAIGTRTTSDLATSNPAGWRTGSSRVPRRSSAYSPVT